MFEAISMRATGATAASMRVMGATAASMRATGATTASMRATGATAASTRATGDSGIGNLFGEAVRTIQAWFRPTGWQETNAGFVGEAQTRLARDVSRLQTSGLALIASTARQAAELGHDTGSAMAGALGGASRALQAAARQSGDPALRRHVADLVLCASLRPLNGADVTRHLDEVGADLQRTRSNLERRTYLAALQALDHIRQSVSTTSAKTREASRTTVLSALWTAADTMELARAWVNNAADHAVNQGGGTLAGLTGGAAIGAATGALAGPIGAVLGLTVGAATGAVAGFFAGVHLGRNWRVLG